MSATGRSFAVDVMPGSMKMAGQPSETLGFPDPVKAVVLLMLAGISGFVVWSFHNADWPSAVAAFVIGGFVGLMAGGLVGVHLLPTLMALMAFGGLFEGMFQGWSSYGWAGAILGGIIGFVAGHIVVLLSMMLVHFVLIVCGIDPFANLDSSEAKKIESPH
jgi:hypothetical protein